MSLIQQILSPANGQSVFNPMIFEYAWQSAGCDVVDNDGLAAIRVQAIYESVLPFGSSVRLLNGIYAGLYTVTSSTILAGGVQVQLTLNTSFIGNSLQTGTNQFAPEVGAEFELISGYLDGPEAAIKPWQVSATINVSPNTQGVYRFDVSGFLRSRFAITAPVQGSNVPISTRYTVRLKTSAPLPSDAGALQAYYGVDSLTFAMLNDNEPIGIRPVLFFGGVPTLYSTVGSKGIVTNHVARPGQSQFASGSLVDLQLLSCEAKEVTWIGSAPTAGFTVTPTLPNWIQATANGNNIELIFNPCGNGVGDYLSGDYNPADYLIGGQINSVTGCFSYVFILGGNTLFTLNACVSPIAETVEVCPADTLNFAWLNSLGGFSSLALEGRFIEGRDLGQERTAITEDRILKRVELRDVYKTAEIRGGVISKAQLDLLADLRISIQAYLYDNNTQDFSIPIVIDRGSFTTYGNRFNQSETRFAFRFRYAQQIRVQTQ